MKVIVAIGLLALLVVVVMTLIIMFRGWAASRSPWRLMEDEGSTGLVAFFAMKDGHDDLRLTPWRSPDEMDFAAIWADDRALAETKVTHMNLGRRKQIGY